MNALGWSVAGVLAGIILLIVLAFLLRTRLLAALGYVIVRRRPQRAKPEEPRALAEPQRNGAAANQ
jgi:hypothetical protein